CAPEPPRPVRAVLDRRSARLERELHAARDLPRLAEAAAGVSAGRSAARAAEVLQCADTGAVWRSRLGDLTAGRDAGGRAVPERHASDHPESHARDGL